MQGRTDLAVEAVSTVEGIRAATMREGDVEWYDVTVDKSLSHRIGKPSGRYVTASFPPLTDNEQQLESVAVTLGGKLRELLPRKGTVLVVGLGNEALTADALGPRTASMVLATRHIRGEFARSVGLDDLRATAVLYPNVLGNTGMESEEIVAGVCRQVHPCAVIAVDALAARSVSRLGCTVQLCDSGIAPGSGVGNNRRALSRDTLGIPVIGLGVPTMVDAERMAEELTGSSCRSVAGGTPMMVTPREIDLLISRAARLLAMSIHAALQPQYSPLELLMLAL